MQPRILEAPRVVGKHQHRYDEEGTAKADDQRVVLGVDRVGLESTTSHTNQARDALQRRSRCACTCCFRTYRDQHVAHPCVAVTRTLGRVIELNFEAVEGPLDAVDLQYAELVAHALGFGQAHLGSREGLAPFLRTGQH